MGPDGSKDVNIYGFEGFTLDAAKRLVSGPDGETLPLMPKAYEILLFLVRNSQRVIEKDELMAAVWPDTIVEENNLTQNISALRRALGEKHRENRFIATVPGRGYKFVADVTQNPIGSGAEVASPSTGSEKPIEPPTSVDRRRSRRWVLMGVVLAGIVLVAFAAWRWRSESAGSEIRAIAVLPFKPLASDRRDESLELGMADALIVKLGSDDRVAVRPLSSVRRFTALDQDPAEAGRAVNVDAVLDGNIQIANDRIRASVRLIRVADSKQLWSGQFDEQLTDIFAVQDSIARRVASALDIKLGKAAEKVPTQSIEAYQLYMRGNFHSRRLIRPEVEKGIAYYEEALKLDPKFALAYVDLANAYRALVLTGDSSPNEYMPKAREAADKAIETDSTLAEAWSARAFVAYWYEWDWKLAEEDYRHALDLDPNSSPSHLFYGHLLSTLGRHDEALEEVRKARERDPASLLPNAIEGQVLFYAGKNDEANRVLSQVLDMESSYWLGHLFISRVYVGNHDYERAIASARRAAELADGNAEALSTEGFALARAGRSDEARTILTELTERAKSRYVPAYAMAIVYAGLGDRSKALDQLERAFAERDAGMVFLKIDPKWDDLRNEPRFQDLLRRMRLE